MTEDMDTGDVLKGGLVRAVKWGACVSLSGVLFLAGLIALIFLGVEDPEERGVWMTVLALSGAIVIPVLGVIAGILTGGSIMAASAVEAATREEGAPPASKGKRCLLSLLFFVVLTAIACPALGWYFDLAYMQPPRPPHPRRQLLIKIRLGEVKTFPEGEFVAGDESVLDGRMDTAEDSREIEMLVHALSDLRSEYSMRIIGQYLEPRSMDSRAHKINPAKARAAGLLVAGFCEKPALPELQLVGVECLEELAQNPGYAKVPVPHLREQVEIALKGTMSEELKGRLQKILTNLAKVEAKTN
jgi:hypothetical protein